MYVSAAFLESTIHPKHKFSLNCLQKKVYYCYQHHLVDSLSRVFCAHAQHKLVEELSPRWERDAAVEVTHCVITLQILCGEFLTHPLEQQYFLSVNRGSSDRLDAKILPSQSREWKNVCEKWREKRERKIREKNFQFE